MIVVCQKNKESRFGAYAYEDKQRRLFVRSPIFFEFLRLIIQVAMSLIYIFWAYFLFHFTRNALKQLSAIVEVAKVAMSHVFNSLHEMLS